MTEARFKQGCRLVAQGLLITALTLALTEVVFRMVNRWHPIAFFPVEANSCNYNQLRARPHSNVRGTPTNALGFRDAEVAVAKPPGVFRILGIGDSFVFSVVPYEYNFLTLLENQLRSRHGAVEVVNMGIPKTGLEDYLALFVHEGLRLDPDMLLLFFFVGNDFKSPAAANHPRPPYLYAFARYLFAVLPHYEGQIYGESAYVDQAPTMSKAAHQALLKEKTRLFRKAQPSFAASLPWVAAQFTTLQEICRQRGIELTVVIIPDELQAQRATRTEVVQRLPGYHEQDYDFSLPNSQLREFLTRQGIDHLDLLPGFQQAGRVERVYKPQDTHWNIRGNQLAAELIRKNLVDSGKLPSQRAAVGR